MYSPLAEMKEAIKGGRSPAIRYASRTWNDKSSGVNVTMIAPTGVCTAKLFSNTFHSFSLFRKLMLVKHFVSEQCSVLSWWMTQIFLHFMEAVIYLPMKNILWNGLSIDLKRMANRFLKIFFFFEFF